MPRDPDADPLAAFLEAACSPRDRDHRAGTLEAAQVLLVRHPELATTSIHAAAALGDAAAVAQLLERDPASATAPGGPYGWDPLTCLCFSRYLRLDRARAEEFVRAATALLDAGASPNAGWYEPGHEPEPVWESAIYGAAGVAHHAPLTRLLLERGGDPNDEETPYHAPEGYDNEALKLLVDSGTLTADSLATILLRKTDWHDAEGIRWLLERGVSPNLRGRWGRTALHNALLRDNALPVIELLLDHGADPTMVAELADRRDASLSGRSALAIAARRGRGDVLAMLARRGVPTALAGAERLIAACAMNDGAAMEAIVAAEPQIVEEVLTGGGGLLAEFAGNGNVEGVRRLLDLGIPVAAPYARGDAYFGIARDSTALHVAAWRARHETVRLLIAHGAPVDVRDAQGRTPLILAVRACVDSYWTDRRSPESVDALLRAGASVRGAPFPSGYAEVDALLRAAGAGERASESAPTERDGSG